MPRNKTLSELWRSKKDPAYYGQMRNQVGEKEVERKDGYSLREQKVVNYTEKVSHSPLLTKIYMFFFYISDFKNSIRVAELCTIIKLEIS